ncbi:MAG: transglutaminase domain-containing protein, partial [Deltaproteobacteria bacterium]
MLSYLRLFTLFFTLLLILPSLPGAATTPYRLGKPPLGDRWFGLFFNDERTGFSKSTIRETAEGYE